MARRSIRGIGAGPGIGLGRAYIYRGASAERAAPVGVIPPEGRDAEVTRLRGALAAARVELEVLVREVAGRLGADDAAVFEAQALFVEDPAIVEPAETAIRDAGRAAQSAISEALDAAARELDALDDPYLRARAADVRDVRQRVARLLADAAPAGDLSGIDDGTVVVAEDLTPSDTVGLPRARVHGIVLAGGTPTAHAAILARGLGIPLVVGARGVLDVVALGEQIILDGDDGAVLIGPGAEELDAYERRDQTPHATSAAPDYREYPPVRTLDGQRIELLANASSVEEARLAVENGAEGIGLLRTEFVLVALSGHDGSPPDEEALTAAYREIFAMMGGRPVVVRAMDAGGDKPLPFLDIERESNPFLGWRGIRVLLDRPDLFASQTRALLRAAPREAAVRLLLPMISGVDELVRARRLVEEVYRDAGSPLARPLQVGVMIEVPAAALIADALARVSDFFSLGTNDLIQYTLACDRGNPRVASLYQVAHPAVLRLIDTVVRAAHGAGRPVGVCGEAAGDPLGLPLLVGLGVDEVSVGPARLPEARRRLAALDTGAARRVAAAALQRSTVEEVEEVVDALESYARD